QVLLTEGGKGSRLARGFPAQFPTFRDHIPTYIASITPKSMEQTGEIADGWIPIYWPKDKIKSGIDTLLAGAAKAGKTRADLTVAPALVMQITDAGSEEQIRMAARGAFAVYVRRVGQYYIE